MVVKNAIPPPKKRVILASRIVMQPRIYFSNFIKQIINEGILVLDMFYKARNLLSRRLPPQQIIYFGLVGVYLLLIVTNKISFDIPSQVEAVHHSLFASGDNSFINRHLPRYFLISPIYFISTLIGVKKSLVFGVTVGIIISIIPLVLTKCMPGEKINKWAAANFFLVFLFSAASFMNGRMVFAILSMSIFAWAAIAPRNSPGGAKEFLCSSFILWSSSVSSGSLLVAYILLMAHAALSTVKGEKPLNSSQHINPFAEPTFLAICLFTPLLLAGTFETITYFDSVDSFLNHGYAGAILASPMLITLIMSLAIMCAVIFFKRLLVNYSPLAAALIIGTVVGLLGTSTFACVIPSLLLLLARFIGENISSGIRGRL
jgi:hypothetical protein